MKKILLIVIAACFAFTGCTVVKTPYILFSRTIDYGKYYDENFYITEANSVSFDYEPAGSITVIMRSGYDVLSSKNGVTKYGREFKQVTEYEVLDEVRKECEKLGGNGVIGFKITYENKATTTTLVWNGNAWTTVQQVPNASSIMATGISIHSIMATGMAIKRK